MALNPGNCPSCGKSTQVKYKPFVATEYLGSGKLKAVSYICGSCGAILGVEVDPMAMLTDITERVVKRLGAGSRG